MAVHLQLRADQIRRYARQILLREVGGTGQARLLAGSAQVTGDGRAAEEAATYLAAAGVGRLVLDAGLAARIGARLARMNPDVTVAPADAPGATLLPASAAAPTVRIAPAPEDDRLAGALAAHAALMELTGARAAFAWDLGARLAPPASAGRP